MGKKSFTKFLLTCLLGIGAVSGGALAFKNSKTNSVAVSAASETVVPVTPNAVVATDSNGGSYTSIFAALLGAPAGSTVNVLADCSGAVSPVNVNINKSLTVDLGGHTLNLMDHQGYICAVGSYTDNIIFKNGTIKGDCALNNNESLFYVNKSKLYINSDCTVINYSYGTAVYLNDGTLYCYGKITNSNGTCISVANGSKVLVSGSSAEITASTSSSYACIYGYSGRIHLSGAPKLIGGGAGKVRMNTTSAELHLSNFNGNDPYLPSSKLELMFGYTLKASDTVAYDVKSQASADKVYVSSSRLPAGYELKYYSSSGKIFVSLIIRKVYFQFNNCTSFETDGSELKYNTSYTYYAHPIAYYKFTSSSVKVMNGTYEIVSKDNWTFTPSSGKLVLNANRYSFDLNIIFTAVAWEDSDYVDEFRTNYMHMSENVTGQCDTYYPLAKAAFNALTDSQRSLFLTSSTFTAAKNRLVAWATAKGDAINSSNTIVAGNSATNAINATSNSMITLLAIIISLSVLPTAYLLISKKRRK